MKIRIEKLEIEVPREFVATIEEGLLRLKQMEAEARSRASGQKESLLYGMITAAINMMQTSFTPAPKTKTVAELVGEELLRRQKQAQEKNQPFDWDGFQKIFEDMFPKKTATAGDDVERMERE